MLKYLIIGIVILSSYVVIFSLLKAASNFDDEVEKLHNEFYEDDGLNEEYDNKYK